MEGIVIPDLEVDIQQLWQDFSTDRALTTKNKLLLHYVGLVRSIVLRMMPTYHAYNEFDDLVSCGVLGLMDAIDKYDVNQGVLFKTYATVRIRGEIIDYMRKSDWAPSSLRRKINAVFRASEELEITLAHTPNEYEIAAKLGIRPEEVLHVWEKSYIFNLLHFEDMLTDTWTSIPQRGDTDDNPESFMEQQEVHKTLSKSIDTLTDKEKTVISLYYKEEMTLKEIAVVLGVSESRISQIHSKVLMKLRGTMQPALAK